jgi:AcrR family transcriptional regulator
MPVQPVAPRSSNAGGRETRRLLIRTAERLFAESGIDAVSLRQIGAAAGTRNSGAVAYHFGDKEGLIRAIIDDRQGQIDKRVRVLLAELERDGRLDDLQAVCDAGIRPAVEAIGQSGYYFRFLAQLDRHPHLIPDLQAGDAFKSMRRILKLQDEAARRHLPAELVEHRRRFATHLVFAALADLEAADAGQEANDLVTADLIGCVVALYSAPAFAPTPTGNQGRRARAKTP